MKLTSLHTKNFPARITQIDRVMQKIQSGRMTIVDWPDAPYYAKYIEQALTELGVTKEEWEVYKNAGQNHNTPELASIYTKIAYQLQEFGVPINALVF